MYINRPAPQRPWVTEGHGSVEWVKGARCCLLPSLFTAGLCQKKNTDTGRDKWWDLKCNTVASELWERHQLVCGCFRPTVLLMNLCSAVLPGSVLSTIPHLRNKRFSKSISFSPMLLLKSPTWRISHDAWTRLGGLTQIWRPSVTQSSQQYQ